MKVADIGCEGNATISEPGVVRLERLLPGPVERIWHHLVDGNKRRLWLAAGEMEPGEGGRVEHLFRHYELSADPTPERYRSFETSPAGVGTVTRWDPPHTLSYTWPGDGGVSEVTFELFAEGAAVLLVVTHRRLADVETMVSVASGWGAHIDVLVDRLNDEEPRGYWTAHDRLEGVYRRRFSLTTEKGVMPVNLVTVERLFDASPAALYSAWTDPSILQLWFGRVQADVQIGGNYRVETDGDGGVIYCHGGRYLALEQDRLIKQTFSELNSESSTASDEFIAVMLDDVGDGKTALLLHDGWDGPPMTDEEARNSKEGWTMWLDQLEEMFATRPDLRR